MVLGVSTSWAAGQVTHGRDLVERCKALNVAALELDYRVPAPLFQQVAMALKGSGIQVVSLHNFCPVPDPVPWDRVCAEPFLLSHTDREERLRAVQWTLKTMEHANALEAPYVVLHCGRVAMDAELPTLTALRERVGVQAPEYQAFLERKLAERQARRTPFLDALLWSLDRLAREAQRLHVMLGLENRAHYHEMPNMEEYQVLLHELEGAPIGYWYDTGHGHLMEIFGWGNPMETLNACQDQLVGIHVHDAVGQSDHLPPGSGHIQLEPVVRLAGRLGCPLIVELKAGTNDDDCQAGVEHVRKLMEAVAEPVEDQDERASHSRLHP
ncbi:sugar phosphate isomerase/epimerase family protein [Desulfosoma caldarium]|uniref:Sugar phosphate isomerase/epimerase n=1 Tax=Desulfosoma caldarium TaxID=610254 RepID=A0A3N1UU83_9BACT|nr:sugar phosphate isomerase/epimerase [Desulfosoma caldarium]ROQ93278.1 sugar phosphate isomerase/epimerase [Desulfosoma caldarium]